MSITKTIYYRVETSLHMGSDIELSIIDMPIQREKLTGFPKIEASGIKGALRNKLKKEGNKTIVNAIFGPEEDGSEYSSCISIKDAKILLFPVKSNKNIFKWVTCPFVLKRYIDDNINLNKENKRIYNNTYYEVEENIELNINMVDKKPDKVSIILEDFTFNCNKYKCDNKVLDNLISTLKNSNSSWVREHIENNIVIVSDDDFVRFVKLSTEVNTRIRIGENGIVKKGALFTEEYLPEETILYGSLTVDNMKVSCKEIETEKIKENNLSKEYTYEQKFILSQFVNNKMYLQLGGNKTLGKGITELLLEKE